jgi:hypothetical protein
MSYTVFISGSRKIIRLSNDVKARLDIIRDKKMHILVGDANGADKAFQAYLANQGYENVRVFCAGSTCRNNVGLWSEEHITTPARAKGREFYTIKDRAMADAADYGLIVWDGKSSGSFNNIIELVKQNKPVILYFQPRNSFHTIKELVDIWNILGLCVESDVTAIKEKLILDFDHPRAPDRNQGVLNF